MADDVLSINQLQIDCSVIGQTVPRALQDNLIRSARKALGPALGHALSSAMPGDWRGAESILCIPKLDIALDIDTALDFDHIASVWARALATAALKLMASPDTMRFENEAERLAAFVSDYLHGRAWQVWYWRDFDGLKPLDPPVALRTVLLRDAAIGLATCRRLRPIDMQRCLATLTPAEAQTLAAAFLAFDAPAPTPQALIRLATAAVSQAPQLPMTARTSPAHFAFALIVHDPSTQPLATMLGTSRTLAVCAMTLIFLAQGRAKSDASPQQAAALAQAMGDCASTYALERQEARAVQSAVEQAAGTADAQTKPPITAIQTTTPFGGAFLLWPHILALPLAALFPGQEADTVAASALVMGQSILAAALGTVPGHILHDPALTPLFGGSGTQDVTQAQPDPRAFAAAFDPWFQAEGVGSAQWCDIDGRLVLKSETHGYWLRIATKRVGHPFATSTEASLNPATDRADAKTLGLDDTDLLIAQLAQIACKRMAYRLPGFADASIGFLRQNFLPMGATVITEEARICVMLDTAPLSIMLNLTGMSRQSYTVGSGRIVQLTQGDRA